MRNKMTRIRRGARSAGFALAALLALEAPAARADGAPALAFPADCAHGRDCYIQNYVDAVPGGTYGDHTCGPLSYDGHEGTDIRLPDLPAMRGGVAVLAAAAGRVRATRDGMPDVSVAESGRDRVAGREAGNGVVIDHGGGWVTQYSHLKRGSVRVHEGQRVAKGAVLGEIGLSGLTEFPHVEFQVRRDGRPVDPFTGQAPESGCRTEGRPLWSAAAQDRLDYVASAVLSAGFAPERPDPRAARDGRYAPPQLAPDSPVLTFWVDLMGPRQGDRQRFTILGPDGRAVARHQGRLPKDQAQRFTYVGARRPEGGWPRGCYTAVYRLSRNGGEIAQVRREVGLGARCP
jgi:hypothetical protein